MRCLGFIVVVILGLSFMFCSQTDGDKKISDDANTTLSADYINVNHEDGRLVYIRHCKACHQVNRMGMPKVYPPLKNTKTINGNKEFLLDVLLNGMSGKVTIERLEYDGVMGSYRNLTDQQIADVLNYIRSDGAAAADLITPEEVKHYR